MTEILYVTDLDGTLLNSTGKISDYSIKSINYMIDQGIQFTVASARSVQSIRTLLKGLNINIPIVAFNGGYVSDFKTGEHICIHAISNTLALNIYNTLKSHHGVLVSTYTKNKDVLYFDKVSSSGMQDYIDDRIAALGQDVPQLENEKMLKSVDIMCLTVIDTKENIGKMETLIKDEYGDEVIVDAWEDMYYKPWHWMTIHSIESTKANALKKLANLVDKKIDEVVVFGDNTNDIEMFKFSTRAYAVENAVDKLKIHATDIIGHHDDNSVVKKIMELEGGQHDHL